MKKKAILLPFMILLVLVLCVPAGAYAKGSDKATVSDEEKTSGKDKTTDEEKVIEEAKSSSRETVSEEVKASSEEKVSEETKAASEETVAEEEKTSGDEKANDGENPGEEKASAEVEVSGEMKISNIEFEADEEGEGRDFRVSWEITGITEEVYVRIDLVTSASSVSGTELSGMKSGASGNRVVSIPDGVASGYYKFMVSATTMSGMYIAQCDDKAFFYKSPNGEKELEGVLAGRSKDIAYAVWDDDCPAMLYMYDAGTLDLIGQITTADKPAQLDIPAGYTDIVIGIASVKGEVPGCFEPYELPLDGIDVLADPVNVEDVTNEREISIVPNAGAGSFRLFKNHKECLPSGNTYTVSLDEGMNELLAFTGSGDGYTTVTRKTIELDTVPPVISLEGTGNIIQTDQPYVYIQGMADQDALVTCDNTAVGMVGNCFSIRKEAAYGTNTVKLRASDKAGNTTICTVEITRSFWSGNNGWLIPIAAAFLFGIAAEIYLLFFRQKKEKKDETIN